MNSLSGETKEFFNFIKKHLFNKVPSASALAGVAAGAFVSSAFDTAPARSMMETFGIMGANADVVSPAAHRIFSVFLPLFAAATTVYVVQKWLKAYRKKQMARYALMAERLDNERKEELSSRLALLEKAKETGLLTGSEYDSKLSGLYHAYTKTILPPEVGEFIFRKLTS